jgi:hypothetical protein
MAGTELLLKVIAQQGFFASHIVAVLAVRGKVGVFGVGVAAV